MKTTIVRPAFRTGARVVWGPGEARGDDMARDHGTVFGCIASADHPTRLDRQVVSVVWDTALADVPPWRQETLRVSTLAEPVTASRLRLSVPAGVTS